MPRLRRPAPWWLPALALALVLTFLGVDSARRLEAVAAVSAVRPTGAPMPVPDVASPSGFAAGQHRLILPATATDGYHWLLQTERQLAGGGLRIRGTSADNAPAGREVHWSSPPRWWLATLTRVRQAARPDLDAGRALEQVAAGSGAMALALLLVALTPLLSWRLGPGPAAFFALAWVGVFPLYETFLVGVVDHHGIVAMAALVGVLVVVIAGGGWVRDGADSALPGLPLPDVRSARRWFAAAGVVSGLGLWLSAATMIPVVMATAVGAVATRWVGLRRGEDSAGLGDPARPVREGSPARAEPELWRLWALAGCATSLLAYAVEYAPSHMGLRLEVNHPLYALAWLGLGDVVTRVWCRDWRRIAGGLFLAAAPAMVVLATRGSSFLLADPSLRSLHLGGIREFQGLASHLAGVSPPQALLSVSALPVAAVLLLWMAWRAMGSQVRPADTARLVVAATPAAVLTGLALWQVRWLPTASALLLALAVTSLALGASGAPGWTGGGVAGGPRRGVATALLVLVLAPFPLATAVFPWRAGYPVGQEAPQIVARDAAHRLRAEVGEGPVVVAAPPTTTTWMIWFGGFRGLGTLYWENREGLRAWEAIASAPTEAETRGLLASRGVTHVLVPSWEPIGFAGSPPGFLAGAVAGGGHPAWLVPLPFPDADAPAFRGLTVRVFRVASSGQGAVRPSP